LASLNLLGKAKSDRLLATADRRSSPMPAPGRAPHPAPADHENSLGFGSPELRSILRGCFDRVDATEHSVSLDM